jgi:hypothetical protein
MQCPCHFETGPDHVNDNRPATPRILSMNPRVKADLICDGKAPLILSQDFELFGDKAACMMDAPLRGGAHAVRKSQFTEEQIIGQSRRIEVKRSAVIR